MIVTIDTGGTKTLISSFNKKGEMGESIKFPTPQDPKKYITTLREVIREQFSDKPVDIIVLAIPGVVRDGVVKWCGNLPWRDVDLAKSLHDLLVGVPIVFENDAKLAGLGETRLMSPIPNSSLYVTISTGIGAGLITNGKIDPGMRYSEVGHTPLEYDGKVQIWEEFASGHSIVRVYKKYARDIVSKRTWYQIADRLSRGFLVIIPIIQPDVIVIGGSVGVYFDRFHEYLEGLLKEHLPEHITCPKIIQARHPEEAVIYGCYYYGKDYFTDNPTKKP